MMEARRPALMYLYQPQNHEPLDAEGLAWLADQLCSDTRVHPDRTMSIGWITTQAAYEYPALHDALGTTRAELAAKDAALREALDLMRGETDMSLPGSDHWVWAEKVRELIGDGETA